MQSTRPLQICCELESEWQGHYGARKPAGARTRGDALKDSNMVFGPGDKNDRLWLNQSQLADLVTEFLVNC